MYFVCKRLLSRSVRISAVVAGALVAVCAQAATVPETAASSVQSEATTVVNWVVATADNHGLPFIIVDKSTATLILYRAGGAVEATAPVLVGSARGDDSPPGIGDRKLSEIKPFERITPAGRFRAVPGLTTSGKSVLWMDYDAAVALHRAADPIPGMTSQSRLARLASATARDNRATLGCVNVTAAFYDRFMVAFGKATGIIYVLPETRSAEAQFALPGPAYAQLAGGATGGR